MKRKRILLIFSGLSMGVLILDSPHAAMYAADGIELCLRTVIPSLFPFFVLSIYLTGNMGAKNAAASVLVSGFMGGYPVGAQAAAESFRTGRLSREQANRLLLFCSQAGPSFLFGIVPARFPGGKYPWLLWAVQLLSALTVAALARVPESKEVRPAQTPEISLPDAVKRAAAAMASVCGWVILFRILAGYVEMLPLAGEWKILLCGMLELTNGILRLDGIPDIPVRFSLAAFLLNFGGLCVTLQTASVIRDLKLSRYLLGKLLQSAFAVAYSLVFLGHRWALIPIAGLFLFVGLKYGAKKSSFSARVGV